MGRESDSNNVYGELLEIIGDLERDHPDIMEGWEDAVAGQSPSPPESTAAVLRAGQTLLQELQSEFGTDMKRLRDPDSEIEDEETDAPPEPEPPVETPVPSTSPTPLPPPPAATPSPTVGPPPPTPVEPAPAPQAGASAQKAPETPPRRPHWLYRKLISGAKGLLFLGILHSPGMMCGHSGASEVLQLTKKKEAIPAFVLVGDQFGNKYKIPINHLYGPKVSSDKSVVGLSLDRSIPVTERDVRRGGDFYYGGMAMAFLEDRSSSPNTARLGIPYVAWTGLNFRMPWTYYKEGGGGSSLADQVCGNVRHGVYDYSSNRLFNKIDDTVCGMSLALRTSWEKIIAMNATHAFLGYQARGVNGFANIYYLDSSKGIHDPRITIGHELNMAAMLRWTWPRNGDLWVEPDATYSCKILENSTDFSNGNRWRSLGNNQWKNKQSGEIVDPVANGWINVQDRRWDCIRGRAHTALRRMLDTGNMDHLLDSKLYANGAKLLLSQGKLDPELWSRAEQGGSLADRRQVLERIIVEQIRKARPKSEKQIKREMQQNPDEHRGYDLDPHPHFDSAVGRGIFELKADLSSRFPDRDVHEMVREVAEITFTFDPEVQRAAAVAGQKAASAVSPEAATTIVALDNRGRIIALHDRLENGTSLRMKHSLASLGKVLIAGATANLPGTPSDVLSNPRYENFLNLLKLSSKKFPYAAEDLGLSDDQLGDLLHCYGEVDRGSGLRLTRAVSLGLFHTRLHRWLPVMHHVYTGEPVPTPHILHAYTLRDGTKVVIQPSYPESIDPNPDDNVPAKSAQECARQMYADGRTLQMMTTPLNGTLWRLNATDEGPAVAVIGKTGTLGKDPFQYGPDAPNQRALVHALQSFTDDSIYSVFVAVDVDNDLSKYTTEIGQGGETAAPVARVVLEEIQARKAQWAF